MNLDGVLEGRFPGTRLIIARDAAGTVQGFHRYATAGNGSDITLDVPWRRRGAPNGIDERLSVDMILAGKDAGAQRVSLFLRGVSGDLRRDESRKAAACLLSS